MRINIGDILKRSYKAIRYNRFLWFLAFLIAFSGAASQSYSFSFSSPIPRGFTAFSLWHKAGEKLNSFANLHAPLKIFLIVAAVILALAMFALRAFSEASAISGVADVEGGRPTGLRDAAREGRAAFFRYVALVVMYAVLSATIAVPSILYWKVLKGARAFVFPCLGGILLGIGSVVAVLLAGILVQLAGRYVVLEGAGVFVSISMATRTFRDYFKDVFVTWAVVIGISIASFIVSIMVLGIISSPFTWLFKLSYDHHSVLLASVAILAFFVLWAVVSVTIGVFAIAASTVWTLSFLDIEPVALPRGPRTTS